jgi:cytochrome c-type biogenesis protein CcsB
MATNEAILFWIALVIYALCSGGFCYAVVFRNERILGKLVVFVGLGFCMHTAAIAARYAAQGHLPWSSNYDNGLMGGWFIVLTTLYTCARHKSIRPIGIATLPTALLIMGYGVMRNPVLSPMDATLKSFWLYIHVFFAWLSFGAYVLAMGGGSIYLLKERQTRSGTPGEFYQRFGSDETLDDLMFRYLVFGFITNAVMIVAGAIWAKDLWGSYWSWDPIETWSLISWLMYGLAIHLRVTMGWRGKRFAWLMIAALLTVIVNFFGVSMIMKSTVHVFRMN